MRLLDGVPYEDANRVTEIGGDRPIVSVQIGNRGRSALKLLLEATEFCHDVNRGVWDFAVEIGVLNENGLSHTDLRWLICRGYLETAVELRSSGTERCFQRECDLRFTRSSCFVLTESGASFVRELLAPTVSIPAAATPPLQIVSLPTMKPIWDRDRQELRIGEQIVKQFKVPAPNQEMVLAAFHEEDWPVRIDDPLPPQPDLEPKRRLHDTIVSLNRNHKAHLIRFSGDGSGQGVRWEIRS